MKKKMIHRLPTPLTHITLVKNNNTPLQKFSVVRILPKEVDHEKKLPLEEPSIATPLSKGKKEESEGRKKDKKSLYYYSTTPFNKKLESR